MFNKFKMLSDTIIEKRLPGGGYVQILVLDNGGIQIRAIADNGIPLYFKNLSPEELMGRSSL